MRGFFDGIKFLLSIIVLISMPWLVGVSLKLNSSDTPQISNEAYTTSNFIEVNSAENILDFGSFKAFAISFLFILLVFSVFKFLRLKIKD